ncbi:LAME_0B01112g1_1 [Lachancea meyersii CBS 8951]|uniref:LAME_0B01112g1_1 n=1 Tax=Lachancea meyersii CBS 8951 TaxID=1266667 RepID=A0A1G4ISR0_9SACH|nr:LAME_0B01112g1_1 [Lachancea meyersii CBS 8951]
MSSSSNLANMANVRRSVWNSRAAHPHVVQMELLAHQLACQDYSVDILRHLIDLEQTTRPCLASFQAQPEINTHMRSLIFDFAMCCHTRLALSSSTLFLCFSIIDRYCSCIVVKSSTYQLVALCGLWLASKYTDKKPRVPSLRALQNLCCSQYSRAQFQEMELHILKALNWTPCNAPPHDAFVDILLKNKISSLSYRGLNINDLKYASCVLCELASFDHELAFDCNASAVALAAVTVATHALRLSVDGELLHYSAMLKDVNLQRVCSLVLRKLRTRNFPSSFKLKYLGQNPVDSNPILKSLIQYDLTISPPPPPPTLVPSGPSSFGQGSVNVLSPRSQNGDSPGSHASPVMYTARSSNGGSSHSFRYPLTHVPPTPSTPSTMSLRNHAKLGTYMKTPQSSASPNTSKPVAPISCATKSNGVVSSTAMPRRSDSKRNSAYMDMDFFDMAEVACKRSR